uniref:Uncharacterized protein n=1 Tax=Anguilla anguilla TaxID=7936 RepID=A0A0E9SSM7_ANGAN
MYKAASHHYHHYHTQQQKPFFNIEREIKNNCSD